MATTATPARPSAETYRYTSLTEHPDDRIRLLTIEPGSSAAIVCHMSCVRLSEEPTFTALSYVWGSEQRDKNIVIDGRLLFIRPKLWNFLDRLQRQEEFIHLWADAICINQRDL